MKSIDLSGIDLNLLVAFEALYEEQSVTVAAQRLHIGQPAMSAALGRLRSLFADDLFVRIGREMKPTTKAMAIAPQVVAVLNAVRETLAELQTFDPATAQQTFTLATADYFGSLVVPKLLARFKQSAPQIDLRLITVDEESFAEVLENGTADLALVTFSNLPTHILKETLLTGKYIGTCRVGHPALTQGRVGLEQLVAFPHALFTLRRDVTSGIDQALAGQGLTRRVALAVPYWLVLPAAIATSDLLAAIPSCLEKHFLQYYPLEMFELPLEVPHWVISMAWSKLSDGDAANLWLRQLLRVLCQEIEAG